MELGMNVQNREAVLWVDSGQVREEGKKKW
jgi:hypothetical protein